MTVVASLLVFAEIGEEKIHNQTSRRSSQNGRECVLETLEWACFAVPDIA